MRCETILNHVHRPEVADADTWGAEQLHWKINMMRHEARAVARSGQAAVQPRVHNGATILKSYKNNKKQ